MIRISQSNRTSMAAWALFVLTYYLGAAALGSLGFIALRAAHAAYMEATMCIDPSNELSAEPQHAVAALEDKLQGALRYVSVHTPRARQRLKNAGMPNPPEFDCYDKSLVDLRDAMAALEPLADLAFRPR